MSPPQVFVLVPDTAASRRLRRFLVEQLGTVRVRVGTWVDLLDQTRLAYLLHPTQEWPDALNALLASSYDAFWHASYQVDPHAVAQALEGAWQHILCSQAPGTPWPDSVGNDRIDQRLTDIGLLNSIPVEKWPTDLATIEQIVSGDLAPHRPLRVMTAGIYAGLDEWQQALINKLNGDAGPVESKIPKVIADFEHNLSLPCAKAGTRLRAVQNGLFSGGDAWPQTDSTCDFIGVRDALESIEAAAGFIQEHCRNNPATDFADFGVLIPRRYAHASVLSQSFSDWGIPLSNLSVSPRERDLGHEIIRFALMRFEGHIPSMALKSLVTNVLMPWPAHVGQHLADTLEQYGFRLKPPRDMPSEQRRLVDLFANPLPVEQVPAGLATLLSQLNRDEVLEAHRSRATEAAKNITAAIEAGLRDWDDLRKLCIPQSVPGVSVNEVTREGVAVITEGDTPWRTVRELIVLDFVDGHFPQPSHLPLVFSPKEWRTVAEAGLAINLPRDAMAHARACFKMQLKQVTERVRFLIPRLNAVGDKNSPSATLTDMALLDGDADDADSLILELESEHDRKQIFGLPVAAAQEATQPREPEAVDMQMGVDLLESHASSNANARPQSPSRLDGVLVSPLAWLMQKLGAEPSSWEPESFSPLTSGTLAHGVFETIFPKGTYRPIWENIQVEIEPAFQRSLRDISPFLSTPEWAVERDNLKGTIERAAEQWCAMLNAIDATIVEPEMWLKGTYDGVAIHGQADAVLTLGERGVVVVDYKNSKADKYEKRMRSQLDLQASLYRQMLKTGGPKRDHDDIGKLLKSQPLTGVAYYTMKDQKASADFEPLQSTAGWRFTGHDASTKAMELLHQRFEELRKGEVRMPRTEQLKILSKAQVPDYALKFSPLTALVIDDSEVSS